MMPSVVCAGADCGRDAVWAARAPYTRPTAVRSRLPPVRRVPPAGWRAVCRALGVRASGAFQREAGLNSELPTAAATDSVSVVYEAIVRALCYRQQHVHAARTT